MVTPRDEIVVPASHLELEALVVANVNNGLHQLRKKISAFAHANAGWREILAVDDDVQYARRSLALARWVGTFRYHSMRLSQLREGNFTYWVYFEHDRCQSDHSWLNGIALPPTHPFWMRSYPPNGWTCSCYAAGTRTEAGIRRLGGDPFKKLPDDWDAPNAITGLPRHIEPEFDGQKPPDFLACLAALRRGEHDRLF